MSWRIVRIIAAKELLERLRDRKTILVMVVLPLVLYPALFFGLFAATAAQQETLQNEVMAVGLAGPAPKALVAILDEDVATKAVPLAEDAEHAVTRGDVLAALVLSDEAGEHLAEGGQTPLTVVFDGGSDRSREAERRLRKAVTRFVEDVRKERLEARGIAPEYIEPVKLESRNVAPPARQGGYLLGQILPLLASVLMITGAFYPAIDLTAGEKERGTLQTLLTAPVTLMDIVAGKYVTVVALALLMGVMNLATIALVIGNIPFPDEVASELSFAVDFGSLLLILVALLLLAAMFGAVMMAVAVTAESFKDAQNYLTPLYLLSLFPLMIASLPGVELTLTTASIPIINLALLMKQLLIGAVPGPTLIVAFASTLAWIALALVLATRVFRMEVVLLGGSGVKALFHRRAPGDQRPPVPSIGEVVTLLGIVLLLLLMGSLALARTDPSLLVILHVTQWGFFLLPAAAMIAWLRLDWRTALALRRPPAWSVVAAASLGAGLWYLASLISAALSSDALPVPTPDMEALQEALITFGAEPGTAVLLFAGIALAPAICEEVLFRGVVLHAFAHRWSNRTAVIASATLFALYHLNPLQMPTTFAVGLVMGHLVIASRSIWPAVILHALHNGLIVSAQLYLPPSVAESPWLHLLLVGPVIGAGVLLLQRRRSKAVPA